MFAEERRALIKKLIKEQVSVTVQQLCDEFDVSSSTIRRDLQRLEEEGIVERTHGGAVIAGQTKFEPSFNEKEGEHPEEKKLIAKKAVDFINEGETILLDAGTTTTEVAKNLSQFKELTIVTNALNIALEIAEGENEIILLGGDVKKKTLALVGPIACKDLQQLTVDKSFVGINGINFKTGLTTPDLVEAEIKRTMIERSKEVIVLADHSKFEKTTFVTVAGLAEVDKIITDTGLEAEIIEKYQQEIEMIIAD